jgi:hypothetical protein
MKVIINSSLFLDVKDVEFVLERLAVCCLHVGPSSEAYHELQTTWHRYSSIIGKSGKRFFFLLTSVGVNVKKQCCQLMANVLVKKFSCA